MTQAEFARFLEISIKSTSELEYQLTLAKDYGALAEQLCGSLCNDTVSIRRMLYRLRAKVLERPPAKASSTENS